MVQKADVYVIVKETLYSSKYFKMKVHAGILCWTEDPYSCQTFRTYRGAKAVVEEWNLMNVVILPMRLYMSVSPTATGQNTQSSD